jgi:SAM-dependent methyltransferase
VRVQGVELESVGCYLCHHGDADVWAEESGYRAMRCRSCGLLYVDPRPTAAARSEAVRTGTHLTATGDLDVTGRFSPLRVLRMSVLMRRLVPHRVRSGKPVRWLDIGCGHGELLVALQRLVPSGSTLVGVEPNDHKARSARARGLHVVSSLDDVTSTFDVVSMMNVYGHLPDPVSTIADWSRLLDRPDGELVIETGNGAELSTREGYPGSLDLPDHLSFIGERHLRLVCALVGLEVRAVKRTRPDGLVGTGHALLRSAASRRWVVGRPYRSQFRDMFAVAGWSRDERNRES